MFRRAALSRPPLFVIRSETGEPGDGPRLQHDSGHGGRHKFGVALDEFADAAFEGLRRGETEIAYGFAAQSSRASRAELDQIFERMNAPKTAG
jgi:hypothetical protein